MIENRRLVSKTINVLVRLATCRGCGRKEECPPEQIENNWPTKMHRFVCLPGEEIPEGAEFVVERDRMPDGWVSLASYRQTPPGSDDLGIVVSEEGLALSGMGVYFCADCAAQIKVTHPMHREAE